MTTHSSQSWLCECADRGCPAHKGVSACAYRAIQTLYRSDMKDRTGVSFCLDCATDAYQSGVFCGSPLVEDEEDDDLSCHCGHPECGAR